MKDRRKFVRVLGVVAVHLVVGFTAYYAWHMIQSEMMWRIINESYLNAGPQAASRIAAAASAQLAAAGFWVWLLTATSGTGWVVYSCFTQIYDPREVGGHSVVWGTLFVAGLLASGIAAYYMLNFAGPAYLVDTAALGFTVFAIGWMFVGYWLLSGLLFTWRPLRPAVLLGPLVPW